MKLCYQGLIFIAAVLAVGCIVRGFYNPWMFIFAAVNVGLGYLNYRLANSER